MERREKIMEIRKAKKNDYQSISQIYEQARQFMIFHGNPNQWGTSYPTSHQIFSDIESGHLYLCEEKEILGAVFFLADGPDETYQKIVGNWINNDPYGVVHRLASPGILKGAGGFCLEWASQKFSNLRIDTHEQNYPMQNLLKKQGFFKCGTIFLKDGSPRLAYQKVKAISSSSKI